eukprot:359175-Chlamydomonas_euryale.AAC.5
MLTAWQLPTAMRWEWARRSIGDGPVPVQLVVDTTRTAWLQEPHTVHAPHLACPTPCMPHTLHAPHFSREPCKNGALHRFLQLPRDSLRRLSYM